MTSDSRLRHILEKKHRSKRLVSRTDVMRHVDDILRNLERIKALGELIQNYVPMRLATLLEVFTRHTVKELVDWGAPFDERAISIHKGLKVDFLFAMNLHGKAVTLGDLVSHELSLNSMGQILSPLTILIPDLRVQLSTIHDREAVELRGRAKEPIIVDLDRELSILEKLFVVRHIVTHELPPDPPYEDANLRDFALATKKFISAIDWIVDAALFGKSPLTQSDMNQSAYQRQQLAQSELDVVLDRIIEDKLADVDLLKASQEAWSAYAESQCRLRANLVDGGSMYPMVLAEEKTELIRSRIEDLRWWIDREEGEV